MKKLVPSVVGLMLIASLVYAEFYRVTVTRKASNVYKDADTGLYIITKYCYEYAYNEEAILKYDKYGSKYDNKLIFDNSECQVEEIR